MMRVLNARELHEKIASGEPLFILDVRNPEEYEEWRIEGENITSQNIWYVDFLEQEGDRQLLESLPRDAEIVVICAKGGGAKMVAEILDGEGYNVSYLEKGMLAWSQFYHPVTIVEQPAMKLIQINRLAKGCLSYMVISDGEALVVDPSRHLDVYLELAEKEHATIRNIVDTHLHADHISGGETLAEKTGATYYISSSEMKGARKSFEPLEKYQAIRFGRVKAEVMAIPTPGHTPGSVSLLVNHQILLSGDTLFVGGLGRPDLGGKARDWAQALYDTVFQTIADLPDEVLVLPAHFADVREINASGYVGATLGEIRDNNAIMRTRDKEVFTEWVAGSVGETPPHYEEIIGINRGVLEVLPDQATELEIGPNRCAVHHS
jgi:glyoxylase-like metal-dependent hydrolase (beta-lactamase superfamily II)